MARKGTDIVDISTISDVAMAGTAPGCYFVIQVTSSNSRELETPSDIYYYTPPTGNLEAPITWESPIGLSRLSPVPLPGLSPIPVPERLDFQSLDKPIQTMENTDIQDSGIEGTLESLKASKTALCDGLVHSKPESTMKMTSELTQRYDKLLGKGHPETLHAEEQISCAIFVGGKHDEAGEFVIARLQEQIEASGGEHPRSLENLSALGLLYGMMEGSDTDKAVKLSRRALEGLVKMSGKEHETTIKCGVDLIRIFSLHGRRAEGVGILKEYGVLREDVDMRDIFGDDGDISDSSEDMGGSEWFELGTSS